VLTGAVLTGAVLAGAGLAGPGLAGAGLAASGGGVLAPVLAGVVPGRTPGPGAGAVCALSRAGPGGLLSSPVNAPAPPATAMAVTISAANSPKRRRPGGPLAAVPRQESGSTAPLMGRPQSGQNFRPGLFCGFPQFRHENAIRSPMAPITPAVPKRTGETP
jgi:hypothetical protein